MHWRIKGVVQGLLGRLPDGERMHQWLQRRAGALANFGRECDVKVDDWALMVGHLRSVGVLVPGTRFLEIGTGWYPTFPIALLLGGARSVDTFDLNPHLQPDLLLALTARLERHVVRIAEATGRSVDDVAGALARMIGALRAGASLEDATDGVVRYRAPADASATGLDTASIDVVFSNSVLEHVPRETIAACFAEARRVLRPGGVMFHSVNCGDHYAYADGAITQLHYLQFSDEQWSKWNNRFLYQNRLRAIDFVDLAKQARFAIEVDTSRPGPERLEQLARMTIAPCFARYTHEQLAITSIDFVGRR